MFSAVGGEAITTPTGAPRANAFAERWVRSVRHELLDRTIIWNERQLRALLEEYVAHYNEHRHSTLDHIPPTEWDRTTTKPHNHPSAKRGDPQLGVEGGANVARASCHGSGRLVLVVLRRS